MSLTAGELISFCTNNATKHGEEVCEELKSVCMVIGGIISKVISDNNGKINNDVIRGIHGKIIETEDLDKLYDSFIKLFNDKESSILIGLKIAFEEGGTEQVRAFLNDKKNKKVIINLPNDSKIHEVTRTLFNGAEFNLALIFLSSKYQIQIENPRSEVVQRYIDEIKGFLLSKLVTHEEMALMQ